MTSREQGFLAAFVAVLIGVVILKKREKDAVSGIDPSTGVNPVVVQKLAEAIARAEGFFVKGSRPARLHNPGDLTVDIRGGGVGIGVDGKTATFPGYIVYATDADGWADLRLQVTMMLNNTSRNFNRDMSILDMAKKYTGTEVNAWARNVASFLGVSVDTRLSQLV